MNTHVAIPTPRSDGEQTMLDWLSQMPTEAATAAHQWISSNGLPNRRLEAFRYSDLRAALADGWPAKRGETPKTPAVLADATVMVATHDGVAGQNLTQDGLTITMVPEPDLGPSQDIQALICAGLAPMAQALTVRQTLAHPIVLVRAADAPLRTILALEEGASAILVEIAEADAGLTSAHLAVTLAPGATLTRVILQRGGAGQIDLSHAHITVAPGARFRQTALAFGGRLSRNDTQIVVEGEGAGVSVNGAYLLGQAAHADASVRVEHTGPGGETREVFKGAVKDRARGVFQGKIVVQRPAQKTDARLRHDALMLSEGASVDAKPELEIWADDVACAHGNTVGALDPASLFYMRQRGIPEAEAKALLVEAFIGEAFDNLEHEALRDWLAGEARTWLVAALAEGQTP